MKRIFATALLLAVMAIPSAAFAASAPAGTANCGTGDNSSKGQALQGVGLTGTDDCSGVGATSTAGNIVLLLSWVIGIIAIIMIMIAGFKYITAAGDTNAIASAKRTLVYAIVGLVVLALAQFIVRVTINDTNKAVSYQYFPVAASLNSPSRG